MATTDGLLMMWSLMPEHPRPTPEQIQAVRTFLTIKEREFSQEHRKQSVSRTTMQIVVSWNRAMWKYVNTFALQAEDPQRTDRAWAALLDLLVPWAGSEDLPEVLRAPVRAASS